jgi:hypothetical protein
MSEVDQASKLLEAALTKVQTEAASGKRVLFPNGIDQLRLKVQIGPEGAPLALVEIEAAGPNTKESSEAMLGASARGNQLKDGIWDIKYKTDLIGWIWVNKAKTEEHWFFAGGFLENAKEVTLTYRLQDLRTLATVKADANEAKYFYVICNCSPTYAYDEYPA